RFVDGVRNAVDVHRLRRAGFRTDIPRAPQPDAARTRLVDLLDLFGRVQDLAAGREVRSFDVAIQLCVADLVVVEKLHERRAHFAEVVRWNVGGHADGDSGRAVDEHVRDSRG